MENYLWAVQLLVGVLLAVLAWNFRKVEAKADATEKEFAAFRTRVAETYVSDNDLTRALSSINQNIQTVITTVARVEERLYAKEQQRVIT